MKGRKVRIILNKKTVELYIDNECIKIIRLSKNDVISIERYYSYKVVPG